jgi:DNA-binding NtrC family response regulator/tetratricopeptide (TPR) repeat protein
VLELIADRFVALGRSWIDIASGALVRLRLSYPGCTSDEIVRNDQCAERARLRHPLMNVLLDYGIAGDGRMFEAYSIGDPICLSGQAASNLLRHAGRFLESRGLPLSARLSQIALREVVASVRSDTSRGRRRSPSSERARGVRLANARWLGVILQPRTVVECLSEALDVAVPGGTTSIEIAGGRGSGLRTARVLAARAARLAGLVPVASRVIVRLPWLRDRLAGRHVCVLLDDHPAGERHALALYLACLGTASARRHVLLRFSRTETPRPGARQIDSMGIAAMTSMVFVDGDNGPSHGELFDAARGAAGRPGLFLERLRAAEAGGAPARIAVVHESSPAYVFGPPSSRTALGTVGRVLRDAPERAVRLAARGRHASAARLLTRAARVLEARGEYAMAAACAEQLAWLLRDRGQTGRALEQFDRARALAARARESSADSGGASADLRGVAAAIGTGVVWTDERRLQEAEASLRAACAAADILGHADLRSRSHRALARCLYWQSRYEEAALELETLVAPSSGDAAAIEAWALLARSRAAMRDVRAALAAGSEAVDGASRLDAPRVVAAAHRSMAVTYRLIGDGDQVRRWAERSLQAATRGHLPLAGLRARCLLVSAVHRLPAGDRPERCLAHLRAALTRRLLPGLLRQQIEDACGRAVEVASGAAQASASDGALVELETLLEAAHAAPDDNGALDAVCQHACARLRAASVQIVAGRDGSRTLARSGRPWQGDPALVTRALATGSRIKASACELRQAAEPIRFGRETIAVLCCRWTLGTAVDVDRASALLRAAALAASASVRSLLDRPILVESGAGVGELLGSTEAASALRAAVLRAARAPFPVLVEGESGSGKELVARGVHRLGPRRDRRLCTVNCAALSDDLLEAELFGHTRGAFTGAVGERAGLFEEADGGTIFLDEVGELSPRAQAKLLRVLQDGEVRRVGENMPRRVDARVVAATNRRLDDEVAAGRFRADLRFRLDVVRIVVPPLRERASDIPALATHFWTEAAARVGTSATLMPETLSSLARYDWPGNVRELQNVIACLAVHAPRRGRIGPAVLPAHIARGAGADATTFEAARHEFERRFVRAALAHAGGQRVRAARTLGVSRQGLAKMMRRLGIDE